MVVGDLIIQMAADIAKFTRDMDRVSGSISKVETAAASMGRIFGSLALLGMGKVLVDLADGLLAVENRLKTVTRSQEQFAQGLKDISDLAQRNYTPLKETATLYTRLVDPIEKLGGGMYEVKALSGAMAASLRLSGATTTEASSAMIQFSQALASGVLRGQEYNSVNEAAPGLMRALATSLGVTQGELRKMAEAGELTAATVGNALIPMFIKLQAEADALPPTIGGAFQKIVNELQQMLSEFDKSLGVFSGLAQVLSGVADYVGMLVRVLAEARQSSQGTNADFSIFVSTLKVLGYAVEVAIVLASRISFEFRQVGVVIGGLAAEIAAFVQGEFSLLPKIQKEWTDQLKINAAEHIRFTTSISGMTDKLFQSREALEKGKLSVSENVAEMVKFTRQQSEAQGGVILLKDAIGSQNKELEKAQDNFAKLNAQVSADIAAKQMQVKLGRDLSEGEKALLKFEQERAAGKTAATEAQVAEYQAKLKTVDALDKQTEAQKKYNKAREGYQSLLRKADEENELLKAQISLGRELTETEKEMLKVQNARRQGKITLTAAELKAYEARLEENEALKDQIKLEKLAEKASTEVTIAKIKESEALEDKADKVRDEAKAVKASIAEMRGAKDASEKLAIAKDLETAATYEKLAAIAEEIDLNFELGAQYRAMAKDLRELAGLKGQKAELQAIKETQKELSKLSEDIGKGLTDSLYRAFESGKGFFQTFWDGLKNTFKTTALKLMIDPVQRGVAGAIGGLFGLTGSANASEGAGGGFGGLGGIGSALGSVGSLLGGFGGLGGLTAGFQGATLAAGLAGPTTIGASGLTGLGASLGAGASALGTALPYLGAAMALFSAVKHKKTPHLGSAVNADMFGATTDRSDYLAGNFSGETDNALRFMTLGSVGTLNKLDTMFGGVGGFSANAKFAADNKDASAADATIFRGAQEVAALFGEGYKLYTKDAGQAFQEFTKDFDGLTLQAIKSLTNLPTYVKAEFDKLGDAATTEGIAALVDRVGLFQGQLSSIKMAMTSLASASDEALYSIIGMAGGIDAFSSKAQAYVSSYYTEAEKAGLKAKEFIDYFQTAGLSTEGLTSAAEFRKLVESRDLNTQLGQQQLVALLEIAPQFAEIATFLESQKMTLEDLAQEAPAVALLENFSTQAQKESEYQSAQQRQLEELNIGTKEVKTAVESTGNAIRGSLEAGLAVVASNVNALTTYMNRFDDGDALAFRTVT